MNSNWPNWRIIQNNQYEFIINSFEASESRESTINHLTNWPFWSLKKLEIRKIIDQFLWSFWIIQNQEITKWWVFPIILKIHDNKKNSERAYEDQTLDDLAQIVVHLEFCSPKIHCHEAQPLRVCYNFISKSLQKMEHIIKSYSRQNSSHSRNNIIIKISYIS